MKTRSLISAHLSSLAVSAFLLLGTNQSDAALVITISGQPGSSQLTMTLSGSETFTNLANSAPSSATGSIKLPSTDSTASWLAASTMSSSPVWSTPFPFQSTVVSGSTMQMEILTDGGTTTTISFGSVGYFHNVGAANFLVPFDTAADTYPGLSSTTPTTISFSGSGTFTLAGGLTFDSLLPYTASNPNRFGEDVPALDLQMVTSVPEPSGLALLGLSGLALLRRLRR